MATVTRTELIQQTARILVRVQAGEALTITDRGRPIARIMPVEADRRAEHLETGALRPAVKAGVPSISAPLRNWSTAQMLTDMRGPHQ